MKILLAQLDEIKELLNKAELDICDISITENGYPDYPDSINKLMSFLSRSDWIHSNYNKFEQKVLVQNVKAINLEQTMALFTYVCRSEKWVTGGWQKHLENRTLQKLIPRAEMLLKNISLFKRVFGIKIFKLNQT